MDPTQDQRGLTPEGLPAETACKQAGQDSKPGVSTNGQSRLVEILADMLRSALDWEEEHSFPLPKSPLRLTSQARSVDCGSKPTKELLGHKEGGVVEDFQ